jgi:DNA-binding transcriptional MerR regulator
VSAGPYRFKDVVELSGCTRSNLIHWTDKQVIVPDVAGTGGTGHHRLFSFRNVAQAAIARELNRFNIPVAQIKVVMFNLLARDNEELWKQVIDRAIKRRTFNRAAFEEWDAFKDPATRAPGGAFLVYQPDATPSKFSITFGQQLEIPDDHPAHVIVNLRPIVERLEAATNDRWAPSRRVKQSKENG